MWIQEPDMPYTEAVQRQKSHARKIDVGEAIALLRAQCSGRSVDMGRRMRQQHNTATTTSYSKAVVWVVAGDQPLAFTGSAIWIDSNFNVAAEYSVSGHDPASGIAAPRSQGPVRHSGLPISCVNVASSAGHPS